MSDLSYALTFETASGQFAGLLLCLLTVIAAFISAPRLFRNPTSRRIFTLSIALRFVLIVLSVTSLFNAPSADLLWFEIGAARISLGDQPLSLSIASADNFEAVQAVFAYLFGPSFYLEDALGLIGFALSVICLRQFIRTLKLEEFEAWILLPFCFMPGSLIYLNYNTREVFQVLFLILTMHSLVRYRLAGGIVQLAKAAVFGYLFAFTHGRYIVVVPALIGVAVLLPNVMKARSTTWNQIFAFPLALLLVLGMNFVSNSQGFLGTVTDTGLVNYVSDLSMRSGDVAARTQFPFLLTSMDTASFVVALPIMFVQFLFAPIIPPLIRDPIDIFPTIDTLVRIMFLFGTLATIWNKRVPGSLRDAATFLLVCYFIFCGVSLLGTLNVGTQQRHQMKIEWVLFLAGAPVIAAMFSAKAKALWRTKFLRVRQIRPVFRTKASRR